jgi:hypothetical protein
MMKTKKKKKTRVNLTLHEDTKQKLTALAQLEKRSLSNLVDVIVHERWEKLAERKGVDYAETVAEIAGLKGLRADEEADRKVFRREVLERVLNTRPVGACHFCSDQMRSELGTKYSVGPSQLNMSDGVTA